MFGARFWNKPIVTPKSPTALAVLSGLLAAVSASLLQPVPIARVVAPIVRTIAEPYDPNPQYSFGYEVQDPLTGDSHGQVESRNGDVVTGRYALVDPDGTRRVVDYTADSINGFNAVVSKEPILTKTVVAQPVLAAAPAPIVRAPLPAVPFARALPLPAAGPWASPVGAPLIRSAPVWQKLVASFALTLPAEISSYYYQLQEKSKEKEFRREELKFGFVREYASERSEQSEQFTRTRVDSSAPSDPTDSDVNTNSNSFI
ncbi:hypothetical protein NQ318_005336 [Aromia moschata]|uniref:Cuticle protein n=1 Tax=Aromia moschata TaxID=1265417 RepID=A0AAV8X6C9_9CUCU|nr:hypothetical protein NQ318_005336 [Aromia moschata]